MSAEPRPPPTPEPNPRPAASGLTAGGSLPAGEGQPSAVAAEAREIVARLFGESVGVVEHTLAFCLAFLSIWFVHWMLAGLLGADARFFGILPIRWFADAGHVAVLLRYVYKLIRQIWVER